MSKAEAELDTEERKRAAAFRRRSDRDRYVFAHHVLREILGGYIGRAAGSVVFRRDEKGKPVLQDVSDIHFNLSHSGELTLVAVTRAGAVGVDVEQMTDVPDLMSISRRFFSDEEAGALEALSAEQRQSAFFRIWTRKEAVLKALGVGLFVPLSTAVFSVGEDGPPAILRFPGPSGSHHEWSVIDLAPEEGYTAAVAVHHRCPAVRRCIWESPNSLKPGGA